MSNNIVKHGQLEDIAQTLWNKAKARDIEELTYDPATKTITGTNSSNNALSIDVELTNLASLDEKAEFKQDVSADNVAITSNRNIGTSFGADSKDRSLGFRRLTTDSFADGYIDHIRINIPNSSINNNAGTTSRWFVWAVKQGENDKNGDTVTRVVCNNSTITVDTVDGNKFVKIPVKYSFENGTYFIVRCTTHQPEIVNGISSEYSEDVINMNNTQPPMVPGTVVNWASGDNITRSNTVVMQLYGRESIGSLSLKLNQVQTDGSKYVLKSETTDGTGTEARAGKVVKLGADGKLNTNMLPELAINRVLTAANKTAALNMRGQNQDQLQLGDVVIITEEQNRVYMCKNEATGISFDAAFIELSLGNGTVKTVNSQRPDDTGNVSIDLEHLPKVKAELDKKISNITLKNDKKHLTVTKADGHSEDVNLTEAFKANNITYGKQIAGADRATVDEALEALNREVGKGVKSIKGGTPDNNGNIEVTVAEDGADGIKVTFGTSGGTAVKIATYMTASEVEHIKGLFT